MCWFMFDYLPVEILHTIFCYLWTNEILYSFLNINDYLDSVILSSDDRFINLNSILRPLFDLTCRHLRPHQVVSLVLSDSNDTPNQSKLFLSRFPINQFTHLRALTLIEIDDDNQSIFSDLENMKYLKSLEIHPKHHYSPLHIMPQLTRFILKYQYVVYCQSEMFIIPNSLPNLRYLSLTYCSYSQLEHIFRFAPMLNTLNTSIMFQSHDDILQFSSFNHGKPPIGLTRLSLSLNLSRK